MKRYDLYFTSEGVGFRIDVDPTSATDASRSFYLPDKAALLDVLLGPLDIPERIAEARADAIERNGRALLVDQFVSDEVAAHLGWPL